VLFASKLTRPRLYRDANVSHIASGFIYNSPSRSKVRVDEAYDSTLGSSLFDYTNVTQGGVANRLWSLSPAITSPPECFQGFSNPAFPLISEDILVANEAIYGGVTYDAFAGEVALVRFDSAISCICTVKRYLLSFTNHSSPSGTYCIKEPSQSQFCSTKPTSFKATTFWAKRPEHVPSPGSSTSSLVPSLRKSLISPAESLPMPDGVTG
jgi:hypothetical protein